MNVFETVLRAEYVAMVRQRDIMRDALQRALEDFAALRDAADGAWQESWCSDEDCEVRETHGLQPVREQAENARLALAAALAEARK